MRLKHLKDRKDLTVGTGSWTGLPRGERAPRVGIRGGPVQDPVLTLTAPRLAAPQILPCSFLYPLPNHAARMHDTAVRGAQAQALPHTVGFKGNADKKYGSNIG